jgi:hypothetical protein
VRGVIVALAAVPHVPPLSVSIAVAEQTAPTVLSRLVVLFVAAH